MPIFSTNTGSYKKSKELKIEWKTFRKGLNLLLRPTELGTDEMAEANNIMLVGSGVPTGRWGTQVYFDIGASEVNGLGYYISKDDTIRDSIALRSDGYLVKKSGATYSIISGQSWPSGSTIRTEQLGNKTYIVSEDVAFTEYAGTTLTIFATISAPTGLSATNFSGVTGTNSVSYKVVQVSSNGGETTPSTNYVLQNLPTDLTKTQIRVFWTAASAATYSGFEIYRGAQGDERWLAATDVGVTTFTDSGNTTSTTISPPLANTTGGVRSKFIARYKDRLLVVPESDPNMLMISGRYPDHYKFSWIDGGGYVYIEPDTGDAINGIAVQPIADKITVYKQRSSYLISLDLIQLGNYYVLDPSYAPISNSIGCSNADTLQTVENDVFYFGRDGLYTTGYEPNYLNIIRTNEISARMRPYLKLLSNDDYNTACALYANKKYILSFPLRKECIVYDRERGSFVGIWKLPFGIKYMKKFYEENGDEKWLIGADNGKVIVFNPDLNNDLGDIIEKKLRTNKTDFGDWTTLQTIGFFYFLFRNVSGSTTATILLENREGTTSGIKSFTITGAQTAGSTGYGMDKYGTVVYGLSNYYTINITSDEIPRWGTLFKTGKLMQIEVVSTAANSNFELLKIAVTGKKMSRGSLASSQRV